MNNIKSLQRKTVKLREVKTVKHRECDSGCGHAHKHENREAWKSVNLREVWLGVLFHCVC